MGFLADILNRLTTDKDSPQEFSSGSDKLYTLIIKRFEKLGIEPGLYLDSLNVERFTHEQFLKYFHTMLCELDTKVSVAIAMERRQERKSKIHSDLYKLESKIKNFEILNENDVIEERQRLLKEYLTFNDVVREPADNIFSTSEWVDISHRASRIGFMIRIRDLEDAGKLRDCDPIEVMVELHVLADLFIKKASDIDDPLASIVPQEQYEDFKKALLGLKEGLEIVSAKVNAIMVGKGRGLS